MAQDNDGWGTPAPVAPTEARNSETGLWPHQQATVDAALTEWGGDAIAWPAPDTNMSEVLLAQEPDAPFDATGMWSTYVAKNYDDDGNGNLFARDVPKPEYVEGPDAWPVNPEDAGKPEPWLMPDDVASAYDTAGLDDELVQQSFSEIADEKLLYESTDQDRAEAANACADTPGDEWFVDIPDGELTRKPEYMPTVTEGEASGFYVAYSQGILHAILCGPYDTPKAAVAARELAWTRFQADRNFALAFSREGWNPAGLYVAEIPLKARRKGAYGPI